jgi:hypothetical protein
MGDIRAECALPMQSLHERPPLPMQSLHERPPLFR